MEFHNFVVIKKLFLVRFCLTAVSRSSGLRYTEPTQFVSVFFLSFCVAHYFYDVAGAYIFTIGRIYFIIIPFGDVIVLCGIVSKPPPPRTTNCLAIILPLINCLRNFGQILMMTHKMPWLDLVKDIAVINKFPLFEAHKLFR